MVTKATSLGGWVLAIVRALESYDIEPAPICARIGIDLEEAKDPNARFEVTKTTRLFELASKASDDPLFGLTVGRFMRPTSWHALGFSIWASEDLSEGLERLVRYFKIYTNSAYAGIVVTDDRLHLWTRAYPDYAKVLNDQQYEAYMSTVVLTCRHLCPEFVQPLRVGLPRKHPLEDMSGFERMFKCPIELGQDCAWMDIDLDTAKQRLPTANPELALANDKICAEYIARFDRTDLMSQVYSRLIEELPKGEPEMERIAQSLNLSMRSLQRKLKEQGSSYKLLVDDVRKQLALQYIKQSHITIGEISYRLGFTHASNFYRAFKRWTGKTPAQWRDMSA
ncbi:MAG: AraC family transcriptional regulator [Amphritea sp.]